MSNSTPNRKSTSVLKDTPLRHGSGSDFASQILKQKDYAQQPRYKPYLEVDTHDAIILPFEDLLSMAFNVKEGAGHPEIVGTIAKSPRFGQLLNKFLRVKGLETNLYAPFNQLVKYILGEFKKSVEPSTSTSITICRNDPTLVKGGFALRKPDCVIVYQKAIDENPERKKPHENNESAPSNAPFYWSELLTFVEFKVKAPSNTAGGKSTSGTPAVSQPPSGVQSARSKGSGATSGRHSVLPKASRTPEVHSLPVDLPGRSSRSKTKRALESRPLDSQATKPPPTDIPQGSTSALLLPSAPLAKDVFYTSSVHKTKNSEGISSVKRSGDDDIAEPSSKRSRFDPRKTEGVLQSASYALEMMYFDGFRTHAFGILIAGNQLEFLCFDRSRTVMSDRLNFETDKYLLVALFYYMAKAASTQLGLVSSITPGPKKMAKEKESPLKGMRIKLNDGINTVLEIIDLIFMQHALVGRGTCVVRAKVVSGNKWKGKKIVVKLSFTPKTRTPEGQILADIVKLANANEEDKWVLDHIPEVLHFEVIEPEVDGLHARLSKAFKEDEKKPFEERVLTVLVMTEQHLIEELKGPKDLMKAFTDIFKCYQWLYETAGVMHKDVSLNNMMFRRKGGKVYGVLSDYDLVLLNKRGLDHSSQHRTGTLPFMAIDLLEEQPMLHCYRHDLESMFYVLTILVTGNKLSPFRKWYTFEQEEQRRAKYEFIGAAFPDLVGEHDCLFNILSSLHSMFHTAMSIQTSTINARKRALRTGQPLPPAIDEETLGGRVNFDEFRAIVTLPF